jgi:hypothetical protein
LFADELIITNQRGAHLAEVVSGVDGAARVVGVDDDEGGRGGVGQRAHAGEVGLPAAPRQQVVEAGLGAGHLAGGLVRREARARQQDVGPRRAAEHRGDGGDRARAARRHEHVGLVRAVHRAGRQVGCDRAVYLVGWFGTARQTAQQHACTRETETETEEREQSWREGWHA